MPLSERLLATNIAQIVSLFAPVNLWKAERQLMGLRGDEGVRAA